MSDKNHQIDVEKTQKFAQEVFGHLAGALVSALLIGMVRGFGTIGFPKFTDGLIYIMMIAILLLRPQGLFGRRA